jgi:phosphoglycolate phosphatase
MKKLEIFDLDGTLTNNINLSEIIYKKISDKYNLKELSTEELRQLKSFTSIKQILGIGIPLYSIPKLYKESREIASEYVQECELLPGMKELLFKLIDNDIKLAIVSSNSIPNINEFLFGNEINIFSFIEGKATMKGKKRIIKKILKKYGYNSDDAVYIGDEVRDVLACKAIGVDVIAVDWGFETTAVLESSQPNFIAKSVEELSKLLLDLPISL